MLNDIYFNPPSRLRYNKYKATVNLLIILTLMKLVLLMVLNGADHIIIYKKIFNNEQNLYQNQLKLQDKLFKAINTLDLDLTPIGFLADDLSVVNYYVPIGVKTGINIYQINIDNQLYAYYAKRYNHQIDPTLIQKKIEDYKQQLMSKHIIAHNIIGVNLFNNNDLDQIFFFDEQNALWRYDLLRKNISLQAANFNNVDYVVGPLLTDYAHDLGYHIYLLSREKQQNVIRLIISEKNSIKLTVILTIDSPAIASRIFLRFNNLIFLYSNLAPQIYKLEYKNKLLITKINPNFKIIKKTLINYKNNDNLYKYELFWNSTLRVHQAIITSPDGGVITYEFNLPTDNNILSVRTNDY